jgi:hypothetical protein
MPFRDGAQRAEWRLVEIDNERRGKTEEVKKLVDAEI